MSGAATFVSHSINYEDVILRRMFPGKTNGFFVDVGAEHPRLGNDFFALYQLGWRGLNIEPNQAYFHQLVAERPGDQNLQLVLSDRAGQEMTFYVVEGTGLSTLDQAQALAAAAKGFAIHEHLVRTSTLRDVLGALSPPSIDVLKVDVEGAEEQVLRGNDWSRFRPALIMVEATYPQTPRRRPTQVPSDLEAAGYRHIHFDGLNDFYAEQGFVVPEGATLPPNVFDEFQRWDFAASQAHAEELRTYITSLEGERASLRDHVSGLSATLAATEDRNRELAARQAGSESMWRSIESLIATLATDGRPDLGLLAGDPGTPLPNGQDRTEVAEANGPAEMRLRHQLLVAHLRKALARNERLRESLKDLRHEAGRVTAAHAQLQGEVISLHRALEPANALSGEVALLRMRLDEQVGRNTGTVIDAQGKKAAGQPGAAPGPVVDARLQEAQQMLEAMRGSTSWRLTRPLRAFRRLLG